MGQILFVVWRESVEALLIVGILHAWLSHGDTNARKGLPYLWAGVAFGLLAALMLGAALIGFTEVLSGSAQDYFQIAMMLIACALIVQMVLWMRRHGCMLKQEMEASLQKETQKANRWGIALLAALAVAREGSETVIFLYGLGFGQTLGPSSTNIVIVLAQVIAALIGLMLAFITFYLLQLGGKIFSWRRFFRVTEVMLLFLGSGLFESAIDKLIDQSLLPTGVDRLWDSSRLLDDTSRFGSFIATLTGYRAYPSLMNLLAYCAYWTIIVLLIRRMNRPLFVRNPSV